MNSIFFTENRRRILDEIGSGLIVLSAYSSLQKQNDMAFEFIQEANFWYATGIEQPDWLVVIDGSSGSEWLIAPEINEISQTFDGSLSYDDAKKISGIDNVVSHQDKTKLLKKLSQNCQEVYTLGAQAHLSRFGLVLNPAIDYNWRMLESLFSKIIDCRKQMARLRAIKQPIEVAKIQQAVDLTVKSFQEVYSKLDDFKYEYEIEALFSYRFRQSNAQHAYSPIVAAGQNACTLHYGSNNSRIHSSDVVTIDIGARVGSYAADITRSFCLEPSKRQLEVYQAVYQAQKDTIELLQPGKSIEEYVEQADGIMAKALGGLGLLKDATDQKNFRKYYPHAVSHGLGNDVHESLGDFGTFQPGMVLTVEPGIYIVDEQIGIRIEDDVLIGESGHEVLSRQLAKEL